jgi:hypothetical protein
VPLSSRCNHKIDCSDQSDETDCQYVGFTSGYLKQLIPANEPSEDDNKEATDQQFVYVRGNCAIPAIVQFPRELCNSLGNCAIP